jgi:hypothetical protein
MSTRAGDAIKDALLKISHQFPECAESDFIQAIVTQAACDLLEFDKTLRDDARLYLQDPFHVEVCGVNPDWVRDVFKKRGCFKESFWRWL